MFLKAIAAVLCFSFLLQISAEHSFLNYSIQDCVPFEGNRDKLEWKIITSVSVLQRLVDIEKGILIVITEDLIDINPHKQVPLIKFLTDLIDHYFEASNPYVHHFINQYHLVRRFTYDWANVLTHQRDSCLQDEICRKIINVYDSGIKNLSSQFDAKSGDLHSADWLLRTILLIIENQGSYNFTLENYQSGKFRTVQTVGLTSFEQLEFSIVSTLIKDITDEDEEYLNTTLYWFRGSLLSYNPSIINDLNSSEDIQNILTNIFYSQPEFSRGNIVTLDNIEKLVHLTKDYVINRNLPMQPDYFYEELCFNSSMNQAQNKNLFCFYLFNELPYYNFRAEAMTSNLSIILIHDFLYDHYLIETLEDSFIQEMVPAEVVTENGSMLCLDRFAKSVGLPDELEFSRLVNFNSKMMYGIKTERDGEKFSSEPLSLVNYGIQGYYNPHNDYLQLNDFSEQNRVMTLMIYLTDVELGGTTIFPNIGIVSLAKKGRALLWYNMDEYGRELPGTIHAACPVFIGNKWIVTKWISEYSHDNLKICRKFRL